MALEGFFRNNTGMYTTDLDLVTQARLRETQNVALAQNTRRQYRVTGWLRRAARSVTLPFRH